MRESPANGGRVVGRLRDSGVSFAQPMTRAGLVFSPSSLSPEIQKGPTRAPDGGPFSFQGPAICVAWLGIRFGGVEARRHSRRPEILSAAAEAEYEPGATFRNRIRYRDSRDELLSGIWWLCGNQQKRLHSIRTSRFWCPMAAEALTFFRSLASGRRRAGYCPGGKRLSQLCH
jgi:hypothetical protein